MGWAGVASDWCGTSMQGGHTAVWRVFSVAEAATRSLPAGTASSSSADAWHYTPLMDACAHGRITDIQKELLLEASQHRVGVRARDGRTALTLAAGGGVFGSGTWGLRSKWR